MVLFVPLGLSGSFWSLLVILVPHGPFWSLFVSLDLLVPFWSLLVHRYFWFILVPVGPPSGYFRSFALLVHLVIFGSFWSLLVHLVIFSLFVHLVIFGSFGHLVIHFGLIMVLLGLPGSFWSSLSVIILSPHTGTAGTEARSGAAVLPW